MEKNNNGVDRNRGIETGREEKYKISKELLLYACHTEQLFKYISRYTTIYNQYVHKIITQSFKEK